MIVLWLIKISRRGVGEGYLGRPLLLTVDCWGKPSQVILNGARSVSTVIVTSSS